MANPTARAMLKLLEQQQRNSGDWFSKTFNDFLDFAVWQLSHQTIAPHSPEITQSAFLAELFDLWADTPQLEDTLGDLYMEIVGNYKASAMGQYFTPMAISRLMAQIALQAPPQAPRLYEPTCGSGANILAATEVLEQNHQMSRLSTTWWAGDLDLMCVKMCAVQCAINSIPAAVWHMDTLRLETFGGFKVCFIEYQGRPFPMLQKLSEADLGLWTKVFPIQQPEPTIPTTKPAKPSKKDQISLF